MMDYCLIYLFVVSVLWSISPILYKKSGIYYKKDDKFNAVKYLLVGFLVASTGTCFFVLSTTKCKSLTKNVTYTYAIPIILTTILSNLIYKEEVGMKKMAGIGLILSGLYLV
tara:strand:- start:181 stop:516 length:336 start_codon:yes stop_codon:yes gene_type:complete